MPTSETLTETSGHLPEERPWETIQLDYESSGVSLFAHPLSLMRKSLDFKRYVHASGLRFLSNKANVSVAGLVICRQMPPTAKGVFFITLEDEFGFINLIVWNDVYQSHREQLLTQSFLFCDGWVQKSKNLIHVIVKNLRINESITVQ